jgi:transcriptional regulator with XRE-family HTH domain
MSIEPEGPAKTLTQLVAMEIRVAMTRSDVRQSELARRIGKTEQWLSVRLRGKQPIDLNDLALIGDGLGIGIYDLLPARETVAASAASGTNRDFTPVSRLQAPEPPAQPRRSARRPSGRTSREDRRPRQVRTPGHTMSSACAA